MSKVIANRVLLILSIPLGFIVALITFFTTALLTSSIFLLVISAILAILLITGGLSLLISRKACRRWRLYWGVTSSITLLISGLFANQLFRPFNLPYRPKVQTPDIRFWVLSTGSRIAYTHVPAVGTPKSTPVIFLHGGPGGDSTTEHRKVFGRLAQDGFDVYLYDQVGSGLSQRLTDVRNYTVKRHVADLEAIRQQIGAERVILIGHSWGSKLAAHYIVAHPERVTRVVFSSPLAVWQPGLRELGDSNDGLKPEYEAQLEKSILHLYFHPRWIVLNILLQINSEAAHNFAGDREMDSWLDALNELTLPSAFCNHAVPVNIPINGSGFYAFSGSLRDSSRTTDIRPALKQNRTPALILRGECDYLSWQNAHQYQRILPHATLLHLKKAGHAAYIEQPKLYYTAVRAFLLDLPLPMSRKDFR
ncbi:alpha/beta fold hydrolase [Iningainema tapete]|uniref:prolyl aminopeptidase n=1 Tax=Iningainema tapete BLCC-T55 TaxID=2748662 RepID=A0A8J6XCA0_9CYAN|nr:alpha/beta fold hydrolase [Iningainema tapete]MBD2772865.1 alpha/beta fold hydrolase [Iningainema tapete BLCC-T55]